MVGIAATEAHVLAAAAFGARVREVTPKELEATLPHVTQALRSDVALDGLGAPLDV
jgi:hypothetical protein